MAEVQPPPPRPPPPPSETTPSTSLKLNDPFADDAALTPPETNKPTSKSQRQLQLPEKVATFASDTDQILLRLDKLLATTAGLDSFLSTINYSLYLISYLHVRFRSYSLFSPVLSRILRLWTDTSPNSKRSVSAQFAVLPPSHPSSDSSSPFGTLASLISETRTTLRLTALLPLYSWLRSLLRPSTPSFSSPQEQDPWLRRIALAQCISYILYQAFENVAYLVDRGILPKRWLDRTGGSARWWLISNRAWLAGVSCDFLRLVRQALLEKWRRTAIRRATAAASAAGRREGKEAPDAGVSGTEMQIMTEERSLEEQAALERKWWSDVFVAGCWFPLCIHWSVEPGLKGVNDGIIGFLGLMAGAESFRAAWTAAS